MGQVDQNKINKTSHLMPVTDSHSNIRYISSYSYIVATREVLFVFVLQRGFFARNLVMSIN